MQTDTREMTERTRLEALRKLEILDTEPEPEFDELVHLAATFCGAPMSLVSLVDEERNWFKAAVGVNVREAPRSLAFCDHAIRQPGLMLVEDTAQDPRFASNPLVTGQGGLRFYAGFPVSTPDGHAVGSLCVLDLVPRTLTDDQKGALRLLASQVNTRFELRLQRRELQQALADAEAAKARLTASEGRFRTFMDSGPFLSYLKDADGRMLYYNKPLAKHFDVSRSFLLGKTDAELWPSTIAASYRRHDEEVLKGGELCVSEEETCNPDGSVSIWRSFKFPCADPDGRMLVGGVSVEVTAELQRDAELRRYQAELEKANRRLRELACVDALTGLANRRVLDERLSAEFQLARHKGSEFAVLLLDVDNFKSRNDTLGHAHGDAILRQLGALLQRSVRKFDLAARYGGEEFALLLPGATEDEAAGFAERLLAAIRAEPWPEGPLTVSIGIAAIQPATPNEERLLTLADEALYAAKRGGKDRAVTYGVYYSDLLNKLERERSARAERTQQGASWAKEPADRTRLA